MVSEVARATWPRGSHCYDRNTFSTVTRRPKETTQHPGLTLLVVGPQQEDQTGIPLLQVAWEQQL